MKTKHLILASVLGLILHPSVWASDLDKKTIVTFPEPMEIPGMVLPEGEYVVKRADHSLPNVMRFSSADEMKVYATVHTIPTQRAEPADDVVIVTEERPGGQPEAIKKWFYPGETTGAEFVYRKSELMAQANMPGSFEDRERTLSSPSAVAREEAGEVKNDAEDALEAAGDNAEDAGAAVARETDEAIAAARGEAAELDRDELDRDEALDADAEESYEIAQATPPPATPGTGATVSTPATPATGAEVVDPAAQDELPRTATGLTLASLLGGLAVAGGAALRKWSRRLS